MKQESEGCKQSFKPLTGRCNFQSSGKENMNKRNNVTFLKHIFSTTFLFVCSLKPHSFLDGKWNVFSFRIKVQLFCFLSEQLFITLSPLAWVPQTPSTHVGCSSLVSGCIKQKLPNICEFSCCDLKQGAAERQ